MLSDEQQASIRNTIAPSRTQEAYIKRAGTPASDGMGGRSKGETTLGPYKVRVTPPSTRGEDSIRFQGRDRVTGDQAITRSVWMVRFDPFTDIRESDRIEVNGLVLQILTASGGHTNEVSRIAQCLKVA